MGIGNRLVFRDSAKGRASGLRTGGLCYGSEVVSEARKSSELYELPSEQANFVRKLFCGMGKNLLTVSDFGAFSLVMTVVRPPLL